MKKKLLLTFSTALIFSWSNILFAQAPNLGSAANFVLFSSDGDVSNSGISQVTGDVGTNNGSSTAFGNVNGVMHDMDGSSVLAAADLTLAYNEISGMTATFFPSTSLGGGQTLFPGVDSINGATVLDGSLTFDANNNSNAVFIVKIIGAFSSNANAKINLIDGAKACNVFWLVEGAVNLASGTTMRGTIIANNAAILISTGDTLEGRALSTTGAVTVDGVFAYTPIGCGSPTLLGPTAPELGSAACFALFSSAGNVSNTGVTLVTGDVGTNVGTTTGFNSTDVTGTIHLIPDGFTAATAADLTVAYNQINALPYDIELLYPAQFGNNLVLTPHTYLLDAAVTFTDSLYLNALGNANAVFVIQVNGALSTSTYAKVLLINGAQAENVYWKVEGAVSINNYSVFCGTIICNNGALGALNTGVTLNGRALTTAGALTTTAMLADALNVPGNCATLEIAEENENSSVSIYPNPFTTNTTISLKNINLSNSTEFVLYNVLGEIVLSKMIHQNATVLDLNTIPSGVYIYHLLNDNKSIQSGKLIAE